jgi:membrane protein DedA with SNARE-associated domain
MGVFTDAGIPLLLSLEIFLMFASYYVGPLSTQVLFIVLMLLLGRETGAAILFWISYILGDTFMNWLQRYFPWFLRGLKHLKARVKRRTTLMVVLVRLTPGFLQVPSIIAGSLHLRYFSFASGVAISSLIYDFGLVLFGFIARETLKSTQQELREYFMIGFIILIILMWLVLFLRFRHIFDEKDNPD